jgi:hypothetical protein
LTVFPAGTELAGISSMPSLEVQILSYFKKHPRASDTLEGIAQWWLPGIYHTKTMDDVRQALEHLVSAGLISASVDISGQASYRLAKRRND